MQKLSEKVATSGFALAMLLLGGVAAGSHVQVQQLNQTRRSVEHTYEVLESIHTVLDRVEAVGRGRRSYMLTGDKNTAAREELRDNAEKIDRAIAQTRRLIQDNFDQQRRLDAVNLLIAKRRSLLQQSLNLFQQNPSNQSAQIAISKQSLSLHQEIESELQAMITAERTLLESRSAAADSSVQRTVWLNRIGYTVGFSLLIGIFSLLLRQIRDRRQAEIALQHANDRLETTVHKRTTELAQVNSSLKTDLKERQLAAQALLKSEKQLRLITDALPVLISYLDPDLRYQFNNRTYEEWFGASQKDLTGQQLRDVVGESAYQAIRHYAEAALAGQKVTYEILMPYKGGTRWVHVTYIPDFDERGEVKGYFALISDISQAKRYEAEHKQIEEQIRQSEARLRLVLQNMPVMLDVFDENWNIIEWNRDCERVTGYRADEVVGNPQILELLYPNLAYRQQMMQEWSDRGNDYRHWEWEITGKDGSLKTISWSNISDQFPIPGWASWGIGLDISDRKQAENQLRQSEQRLGLAIEGSGMATWDVDIQADKVLWSEQHFKLLGYDPVPGGEVLLEQWHSRVHPEDRAKIRQALTQAQQERSPYRIEHRIIRADNAKIVWVAAFGRAVYNEAGQAVRFLGILLDISDRKQAEEALKRMNEELEIKVQERTAELKKMNADLTRSNQELEQFAYVASHDLQEPLRAVSGYTRLLAKDYTNQLDETGQQYAAYVMEGASRMQQLIQDLLEYSRVGTRDLVLAPTDCNAVLKRVLDILQVAIAENSATITHDPLPTITADKTQLTQLFQNLIGNAIKFRREEPLYIHITTTPISAWSEAEITPDTQHLAANSPEWLFSIRDNGIGIKPRYLERIFEIFKRLHTRREFAGTGIGLAICKKIVDRHHGRIWAESQLEIGTTFYFTIPTPSTPHPTYGASNPQLNRDSAD